MEVIEYLPVSFREWGKRKGETEKKIAFLSERRAALGQQADRAYEEIASLEQKDSALKEQFKSASAELTKRRITSQMLQLRKDMERRQQLVAVLNQQINVVGTHLHNLSLVQQGSTASRFKVAGGFLQVMGDAVRVVADRVDAA